MKKFLFIVVMVLGTINCNAFSFFGLFPQKIEENANTQKRHADVFIIEDENTIMNNVDILVTPTDSGKVQVRVLKGDKEVYKHIFKNSSVNQIGNSDKFTVNQYRKCKPMAKYAYFSIKDKSTLFIINKDGLR